MNNRLFRHGHMHDGEDGADDNDDDDVKMAIPLLIIFSQVEVGNSRAPFQLVCRMYVPITPACSNARKQRTPKMLDNATQKYLVQLLPFGENLLASTFSSNSSPHMKSEIE